MFNLSCYSQKYFEEIMKENSKKQTLNRASFSFAPPLWLNEQYDIICAVNPNKEFLKRLKE